MPLPKIYTNTGHVSATSAQCDVSIMREGSIILLIPQSKQASYWIRENCELESWQWFGGALAVDIRVAAAIVEGMREHGFKVVAA